MTCKGLCSVLFSKRKVTRKALQGSTDLLLCRSFLRKKTGHIYKKESVFISFTQYYTFCVVHRSFAPLRPLPLSPSYLTYTKLGATGTADHLTLLRPLHSWKNTAFKLFFLSKHTDNHIWWLSLKNFDMEACSQLCCERGGPLKQWNVHMLHNITLHSLSATDDQ